jgi:hypothetical protein
MKYKCPGQDACKIQAESVKCPECGYVAEIFTDEVKVKCCQCRSFIYRSRLPSCLDWCKSARECSAEEE